MNRRCLLDFESLVWDKAAFQHSKQKYYVLLATLPRLFTRLRSSKTIVVFSPRLLGEIWGSFPFAEMKPNEPEYERMRDFHSATLGFFGAAQIEYIVGNAGDPYATAEPEIKKDHFSASADSELDRIITEISEIGSGCVTFFSLLSIWPGGEDEISITRTSNPEVKIEVVLGDQDEVLDEYFERKMNVFDEEYKEHIKPEFIQAKNPKKSRLSCYDGKNVNRCQELLDRAISSGDCFYNFDGERWVVFRRSFGGEPCYRGNNPYHGHDVNDENDIPPDIRELKDALG